MSGTSLERKAAKGELVRQGRGIYRHAAVPPSWRGDLIGHVLASGGVASHRCAAALHRIDAWREPPLEVTLPLGTSYQADGVRIHHSKQWARRDELTIDAIPCTGVARTILDFAAVTSIRRVELAAESAIRKNLLDWPDLWTCYFRHSIQGRDGAGRLRELLEARSGDETIGLSGWSTIVRHLLSDAGLPLAVLEHRIVDSGGAFIMQADLAWPDKRVAVELDSIEWHLNRKSFETDRAKRNRARVAGWIVHEITWRMFVDDPRSVVDLVRSTLAARKAA